MDQKDFHSIDIGGMLGIQGVKRYVFVENRRFGSEKADRNGQQVRIAFRGVFFGHIFG